MRQWFRIKKTGRLYAGRPFLAVEFTATKIGGWIERGGTRGFAPAMRYFDPDQLEPLDKPPKIHREEGA
jgi:hypothetical protein